MTPSRIVQTCANRALNVLPVALARAEYVPMPITWLSVSKIPTARCAILKFGEQTCEEIEDSIESKIHAAVRKTFDHFPTHVRRKLTANDFRVSRAPHKDGARRQCFRWEVSWYCHRMAYTSYFASFSAARYSPMPMQKSRFSQRYSG